MKHGSRFKDIAGQRFGHLVAITEALAPYGDRHVFWLARCDCGAERVVQGKRLRIGHTTSCGCARGEDHGLTGSSTYVCWGAMIQRCYNASGTGYHKYGGRGIKVCERWRNSFSAFYEDMGERPSRQHSLDRIDNNSDYEPGNCKWSTAKEQARNRRSSMILEAFGRKQTLAAWGEEFGVTGRLIGERLLRGWSAEKAISTPPLKRAEWSNALGDCVG
jgi:hypothetical protein